MEIELVLASYPALVGGRRPRWLGHTLRDRTRRRSPRVPLHSFSSFCRFGVVSMAATPPWWRAANSNLSRAAMEAAYDKFFDTSSDESTPPSSPDVTSFGCVPHIQPQAQNDMIEAALGIEETNRFYASVMGLFER